LATSGSGERRARRGLRYQDRASALHIHTKITDGTLKFIAIADDNPGVFDDFIIGDAECVIAHQYKSSIKPTPVGVKSLLTLGEINLIGEILDAQCYMGIMNPGYGRSHRGCATQCIRGGQPVYFSMGLNSSGRGGETWCGVMGYLLANSDGHKVNAEVLNQIAIPITLTALHQRIGNLNKLVYSANSLARL